MQDDDTLIIRPAVLGDLSAIIGLLADDPLGAQREALTQPLAPCYIDAFEKILANREAQLLVVEIEGVIAGTAQLNYLTYLTYQGGTRAQIEGVRVHKAYRHHGVGELLLNEMIAMAHSHGCHVVQLTVDRQRPEAKRFYQKLGFQSTHDGLKLHLHLVRPEGITSNSSL